MPKNQEQFEFDQEGNRVYTSPCVELSTNMGMLALSWANTTVHCFPDKQFDHLVYENEDGKFVAEVDRKVIKTLVQHHFPRKYWPYVPRDVLDRKVGSLMEDFESELKSIDDL